MKLGYIYMHGKSKIILCNILRKVLRIFFELIMNAFYERVLLMSWDFMAHIWPDGKWLCNFNKQFPIFVYVLQITKRYQMKLTVIPQKKKWETPPSSSNSNSTIAKQAQKSIRAQSREGNFVIIIWPHLHCIRR